jgi:hypothetical protein
MVSDGEHNTDTHNRLLSVLSPVKDEKHAHQNHSNQNYNAPFSHDV